MAENQEELEGRIKDIIEAIEHIAVICDRWPDRIGTWPATQDVADMVNVKKVINQIIKVNN